METRFDAAFFGESMIRLSPIGNEKLQSAEFYQRFPGGAELNVAAGLAQLGLKTAFCTKIPNHPLSQYLVQKTKGYGVSDDFILYDSNPQGRLGVYYYEKASAPQKPKVIYDRLFSSFRTISIEEIPSVFFKKARLFHTSGITLGLCNQTKETALLAMKKMKENGALLSFDVNYRANLWTEKEARNTIEPILPMLDLLFISEESLRRMFGQEGDLPDILRSFSQKYHIPILFSTVRKVISPTHHTFTSFVYHAEKDLVETEQPYEIDILDRIGSGDAYVAGALFGILSGQDKKTAMQYGNAMAAAKCGVSGDISLSTKADLDTLISSHSSHDFQSEMNR